MKKFILTMVVLSVFLFLVSPVMAVAPSKSKISPTPTPTVKEPGTVLAMPIVAVKKLDYVLPYPGLLPDHPLYFLKKFRDFLFERLIVDTLRKGEFFILQADKDLNAAIFLFDSAKGDLGRQMATLAETDMAKAVDILAKAKTAGKEIPASLIDKLEKALAKHVEVLTDLLARANAAQKEGLTKALEAVKLLQSQVGKLK